MTELHALLDAAVARPVEIDVAADVRRGHQALSRRRHRSLAQGAVGLALVTAAAVAGSQLPDHATDPQPSGQQHRSTPLPRYALTLPALSGQYATVRVGSTLTVVARGVHVWNRTPLRIDLPHGPKPAHADRVVMREGRRFFVYETPSGLVVRVRDHQGRWVRLQVPRHVPWSVDRSVRFLAGVKVHPRTP
ncbi:MAG: hypothetical protein QM747_15305 [Nocardioides sp.]